MAGTDEQINLTINARNQASAVLNKVKGDLREMDKAADVLGGGFSGLAGGLLGGALVAFGTQAAGAVRDMAVMGAAAKEMRGAFDGLALSVGLSGDAVISAMRAAAEGMVADTELTASATQALSLHAADSIGELTALMEVAKVRSDAMGISITQAFDALASSIGKVQERGLYALGISLDMEQVNEDYAASLGKTASALSEAEKRQAMYNAVVADSAEMVANAAGMSDADKLDRAAAAWANMKMHIGEALSPAVAASATFIADAMDRMAANEKIGGAAFGISDAQMLDVYRAKLTELNDKLAAQHILTAQEMEQRRAYAEVLNVNVNALGGVGQATDRLKDDQYATLPAVDAMTNALWAQADAANAANAAVWKATAAQGRSIEGSLLGMAGDLGAERALALNEQLNSALDERTRKMILEGKTKGEIAFANAAWEQEQIGRLQTEISEREKLSHTLGSNAAAVNVLSSEYSDLKGRVEGVLLGALGDTAGVKPEDFLPREDAVAENARRLADIMVNGLKGQEWLEDFMKDVPDIWSLIATSSDPKTMAASLLKDFQDGLRPDLLDKEKAKELVRAAIIGDQNMSALANEISSELAAEMGISVEKAKAAVAGVLGGGSEGSAGQIAEGMNPSGEGERFVMALATAIKDKSAELYSSGQAVGAQWGAGFMAVVEEHVPPSLIGILANLVTPAVAAQLNTQGTQTGALP